MEDKCLNCSNDLSSETIDGQMVVFCASCGVEPKDPHPETCRCHPCDRRRIADLEAKNTRLREALSFTTNAIDPEQSDETADWELTDIRWRKRLNEMHAELKHLQCYPNAVLIIRNKYPIDVFPDTNVAGRMARLTCDNILELASERIEEVD